MEEPTMGGFTAVVWYSMLLPLCAHAAGLLVVAVYLTASYVHVHTAASCRFLFKLERRRWERNPHVCSSGLFSSMSCVKISVDPAPINSSGLL